MTVIGCIKHAAFPDSSSVLNLHLALQITHTDSAQFRPYQAGPVLNCGSTRITNTLACFMDLGHEALVTCSL